ncbi:hypothetical protein DO97_02140 [Neosynechococcus sphagnicola sy1]|uniref:Uncharacterized protein n=2 Tax=Neosynechococcus TaxID=1501143 RepID=A0A098TMQ3_9CYAN|nr:hypothetical protein DO97_02140 [Neosynechococcus sphagnicola sy1]
MEYPARTIARANRALRCAPFDLDLFVEMQFSSVALSAIAGEAGVEHHYTLKVLPEFAVEHHLLWLIQVGVLRREVDGQGLTDSFRLTPLGRQLVERWQHQSSRTLYAPTWGDRLLNFLRRWLRLPL